MDWSFNREIINHWYLISEKWIFTHIISWELLAQLIVLLVIRLIGALIGKPVKRVIDRKLQNHTFQNALLNNFITHLVRLIALCISVIILWITIQVFIRLGVDVFVMRLLLNLSIAWIIIQLASSVILDEYWSKVVAGIIWFLTALNIIDIFDKVVLLLRNNGLSIGQTRLTFWALIQTAIIMIVLLRLVNWSSRYLKKRLDEVPGLNSTTRLIMSKIIHVTLIVLVTLVVLNSLGIDFSSLAIFSGAIGVGVGFGLQKVVANYISGLILLSDKSVKPGDVIQLGETFGWVRFMGGRYVSVVTRDEKEYLIPNEDLITQQVVNWSYSNNIVRLNIPFGISYKADPHQVIELVIQAVSVNERILTDPKPSCLLMGFGDSSVDLELRFWIKDPQNGLSNIKSQVLLKIWDVLKENQIEIPFPQREIHIKT